jgi:hypothetical protein
MGGFYPVDEFDSMIIIIMSIWSKGWIERFHPTRCGSYGLGESGVVIWRKPDHFIRVHYYVNL